MPVYFNGEKVGVTNAPLIGGKFDVQSVVKADGTQKLQITELPFGGELPRNNLVVDEYVTPKSFDNGNFEFHILPNKDIILSSANPDTGLWICDYKSKSIYQIFDKGSYYNNFVVVGDYCFIGTYVDKVTDTSIGLIKYNYVKHELTQHFQDIPYSYGWGSFSWVTGDKCIISPYYVRNYSSDYADSFYLFDSSTDTFEKIEGISIGRMSNVHKFQINSTKWLLSWYDLSGICVFDSSNLTFKRIAVPNCYGHCHFYKILDQNKILVGNGNNGAGANYGMTLFDIDTETATRIYSLTQRLGGEIKYFNEMGRYISACNDLSSWYGYLYDKETETIVYEFANADQPFEIISYNENSAFYKTKSGGIKQISFKDYTISSLTSSTIYCPTTLNGCIYYLDNNKRLNKLDLSKLENTLLSEQTFYYTTTDYLSKGIYLVNNTKLLLTGDSSIGGLYLYNIQLGTLTQLTDKGSSYFTIYKVNDKYFIGSTASGYAYCYDPIDDSCLPLKENDTNSRFNRILDIGDKIYVASNSSSYDNFYEIDKDTAELKLVHNNMSFSSTDPIITSNNVKFIKCTWNGVKNVMYDLTNARLYSYLGGSSIYFEGLNIIRNGTKYVCDLTYPDTYKTFKLEHYEYSNYNEGDYSNSLTFEYNVNAVPCGVCGYRVSGGKITNQSIIVISRER